MREDSAEEISSPTTVLALVKAPLASMALGVGGESFLGAAPVEILTLEALAAEDEVSSFFLETFEEVVIVVFPAVAGNLTLELSVVLPLEEDMSLEEDMA